MSYPHVFQVLVIEDEPEAKELYDAVFDEFVKNGTMDKPRYAFCYQDATEALSKNVIYHLVILDLRLPDTPRKPPSEGLNLGLQLLEFCENRDDYPIPALLICSGYLGDANQSELRQRVEKGFSYGSVLVKGGRLRDDIKKAVERILQYCRIGIHLHDAAERQYPTLSPRDEDLLRRCVLDREHIGVDLEWWVADSAHATGQFSQNAGWTKTLMGRFILGEGMGLSLPTFYKFSPIGDATGLRRNAEVLSQKLNHIKPIGFYSEGNRCLLVTQKVGDGRIRPVSLEDWLGRDPVTVTERLPSLVRNLVEQVIQLGDNSPDMKPINQLLWPYHNHTGEQWERLKSDIVLPDEFKDPVLALRFLQENHTAIRYNFQSCLHGDLNITNIAIDVFPEETHAYIFDAGYCCGGVNIRDFAMLEVTALLHQKKAPESIIHHCAGLYGDEATPSHGLEKSDAPDIARNTFRFITELREQAFKLVDDPSIYALMVFDVAMMQLGGLHYQVSSNKIGNPRDAALLAALTTKWLYNVASDFINL